VKKPLDPKYWSNRYRNSETGWDTGQVTTPIKTYVDQLTNKDVQILIPGAGNGYEAEYLFNKGFKNIYVCDFAAEPLKNFKKRCPQFDPAHLVKSDFFKLSGLQFDLIIEQTFFCALHPSLREKYFQKMQELLKPGGRLVGLLFDDKLNNDKPPFGGRAEEYPGYFEDYFDIHTYEKCYNSIPPRAGRELFINLKRK
jgi:methyl halide transferase